MKINFEGSGKKSAFFFTSETIKTQNSELYFGKNVAYKYIYTS